MTYQLYWGDLHSHCSISYGHGTVEQALMRARQQLDFCSITGHAFWPDMPTDRDTYGEIIDYHRNGFATLAGNWEQLLAGQAKGSCDQQFLALPSYEWHSLQYGDHNVYGPGPELPLQDAPDLPGLRQVCHDHHAIMIPHHIGYSAGYRGIDWQHFQADRSPFVEIFSLHGCSLSEDAPYPMLHDMGPRDGTSVAEYGWQVGHRFGIVAGTDHHAAFPGSHGDGRMGVFATDLTRESLWEAFLARRVFAATGDNIDARMWVDDAWIGDTVKNSGTRNIRLDVRATHQLDRVELVKNGKVIRQWSPPPKQGTATRQRLRLTWGWGRKDQPIAWQCKLRLHEGTITNLETHFSGQAVAAPQGIAGHTVAEDQSDLPHAVIDHDDHHVAWRSVTMGNPTMRHATTQAMTVEIDAPETARITVETNDRCFEHTVGELSQHGRSHYLRGWLSEAIQLARLVPIDECALQADMTDEPSNEVDLYRLQVAQRNGQWAWLSPVWVEQ